jgi:predicted Zn-dependent protease
MTNFSSDSTVNPPPSNRQLLILLGLFLGTIFAIVWGISAILNNLVWLIPNSVEQQLGSLIVPTYEKLAEKSPTQDTLNQLLDRLESNLPNKDNQRNWQVLYIPEKTVNAIAIPGDRIIIYKGLLNKVQSENELMMVLGHELGHFANRDHIRAIVRQLGLSIAITMIFGDSSGIQATTINAVQIFAKAKFSQNQETQADKFGLELLQKTYGHVGGATDFFQRISNKIYASLEILASHPAPENRVKHLQNLIQEKRYPLKETLPLSSTLKISE